YRWKKKLIRELNEVIEITPSPDFRKLLAQISNSLRTGADVSVALESITDQITKEHLIKVKEYGKKINPLVMFYLLIAIIVPSLGVAMLALLSAFTGLTLNLGNLIGIAIITGLIQISFLSVILTNRPGVQ
ncbi:MAG: type II secretion system F family protein, partial [Nanoarchaeota archaeon]